MQIINPAPAIARHTRELLQEHSLLTDLTDREGTYSFISTGGETIARQLRKRAETYMNRDN